jgi:2-methylcitrate dehydratase PrpD
MDSALSSGTFGVELGRWLAEFSTSSLVLRDPTIANRAMAVLLDDLAAIVASTNEPEVRRVAELATKRGRGSEATVIATSGRAERGWAALANGIACSWNELDEGYRPTTCHGGLYAVPAAIAEAEASDASLAAVLTSIVAGYEVAARVARAFPAQRPLVLHPHATLSACGAAAAIASMRRMDAGLAADVLGTASTFACVGPFNHAVTGALVRNAWAGVGAWLGFAATDLAAAGVAGTASSVADVFGDALRAGHEVNASEAAGLEGGLGERLAILDGYHKMYACCQYAHSAVEAALALRAGPLSGVSDEQLMNLGEVEVETHPLGLTLNNYDPTTALAGKFSLPQIVSAVLASGEAGPRTFSSELLSDPVVGAIRRSVRISPYLPEPAPPLDRPARVRVTMADGVSHVAECQSSIGSPDRPLSLDEMLGKIAQVTHETGPSFVNFAHQLLTEGIDLDTPWSAVLAALLGRSA